MKKFSSLSLLCCTLLANSQNPNNNSLPANGNIGVNFTAPIYKADIIGTFAADGIRVRQSGNNSSALHLHHSNSAPNAGHNWSIYSLGPTDGWAGAGSLAFQDITGNNSNTRLIIDATGRMGLGVNTPSYKYDVFTGSSNDGIRIFQSGNTASLLRLENLSSAWSLMATGTGNTQGGGNFSVNQNSVDRLFINGSNGNVGIGTGAPNANLQIGDGVGSFHFSGANAKGLLMKFATGDRALMELHNPSGTNRLIIESLDDAAYVGSFDSKPLDLQPFGGKVGIGTNTPVDRFQIANDYTRFTIGQANSAGLGYGTSYIGFNASRSSGNGLWTTEADPIKNGASIIYGDVFGNLLFSTLANNAGGFRNNISDATVRQEVKLLVMANGNVIINSKSAVNTTDDALAINDASNLPTSSTCNFKVKRNGTVYAREIFVHPPNYTFPDYVFEKDYKLLGLDDLKNFIDVNKHLPNVPSAREIDENGIAVSELSKIQMEKIEELTLYVIELKKEIEQLKKEIKDDK